MKRATDVAVAVIALIVFAPEMLVCAALIKLQDGGPVVFSQRRIGSHGRTFTLHQLRTMRSGSSVARWSSANDPRVTPIGRWLRRTHVESCRSCFNVLRGEMTLVGPRPEQPEFVDRLERGLPHYNRLHLISPA